MFCWFDYNTVPGNTPLVRIASLSDALGVEILGKAEVCRMSDIEPAVDNCFFKFLNPGGSVKDRVALRSKIMAMSEYLLQLRMSGI
jgi:cysteine synthase